MSKITISKDRVDGQTVYAWAVGDKGGYCATEADARKDARIASERTERTGHTPGEWIAADTFLNNAPNKTYLRQKRYGGDIIADMGPTSEVNPANARLLAAAPELLETLKSAVRVMERQKLNWEGEDMLPHYRNVIAKAEGAI